MNELGSSTLGLKYRLVVHRIWVVTRYDSLTFCAIWALVGLITNVDRDVWGWLDRNGL